MAKQPIGICFGYDTGQISGFQEMDNFLYQFADERNGPPGDQYLFSWRRSGLIVGMVGMTQLIREGINLTFSSLYRYPHRRFGLCSYR